MNLKNRSGFTLLEIIIVIIIVGVLASLALPRFFSTVEFSRSTEALASITAVRQSLERCYLQRSGTYVGCSTNPLSLDLEDPSLSPNAHFTYGISGQGVATYTITATRLSRDGGTITDTITLAQDATGVSRGGTTKFVGIR